MMENEQKFQENFHIKPTQFNELFDLLEPFLMPKVCTRPEDEITPKEKLAIVLEYIQIHIFIK